MAPPLTKDDRTELEAFKSDVKDDVHEMNQAAIAHVERIVAPFAPLAQDVAQLKKDTATQTPIIERLDRRSRRADQERKRRSILDAQRRKEQATWKRRWRMLAFVLGLLAAAAELYRGLRG